MHNLIIGNGEIKTNEDGYLKLIIFYEVCRRYTNDEIIIDFEGITWIDGNMSALLMAIILKLKKENNINFFVDQAVIQNRFDILIRNGWLTGVEFVPKNDKTEIKLTGFDKAEDVKFIQYIEKELLSNPNLSIDQSVKDRLMDSFLELFCNVQKHARTDSPIFVCGQYYPLPKRLCFTLVDSGVGYLIPIKEFTGSNEMTGSEAIQWALNGNTTKKDAPGGLGLKEIQRFCSESGSTFAIITSGYYWTNYQLLPTKIKHFCGTIVNVIFDCKHT
jgi:hypothetical protein